VRNRLTAVLLAVVPPLALIAALSEYVSPTMPSFALVSAVFLLLVASALLPATVMLLARRPDEAATRHGSEVDDSGDALEPSPDEVSRSGDLPVPWGFTVVVVLASLAQSGVVLMTTSSGPLWGIPVLGLVPSIMCLLLLL